MDVDIINSGLKKRMFIETMKKLIDIKNKNKIEIFLLSPKKAQKSDEYLKGTTTYAIYKPPAIDFKNNYFVIGK